MMNAITESSSETKIVGVRLRNDQVVEKKADLETLLSSKRRAKITQLVKASLRIREHGPRSHMNLDADCVWRAVARKCAT
jgi:hypothetical protein